MMTEAEIDAVQELIDALHEHEKYSSADTAIRLDRAETKVLQMLQNQSRMGDDSRPEGH